MKSAAFCIKHRVTTIMAFIMVVIFGIMGFSSLPLAMLPSIEMPMAIVYATYIGAGPEEIENLITKPLESAAASVSGMDSLQSQSSENMGMVMVNFADGTNMDEALTSLRDKINQVRAEMPDDASAPTVMKLDIDAMPVAAIGLRGADLAQLQQIAEDDISPAIERIDGVAQVQVMGGFGREVAIYTEADKMNGYGLSIAYLSQILAAENVAIPAGDVQNGSQRLAVRTTGEFSAAEDIADVLIPLPAGGTVRLGDIASIAIQPAEQDAIAGISAEPSVVLSIMKQSDVNTVQVANRIKAQLDALTAENPTLDWMLLFDQSAFINQAVDSVISNILLGVLLAALVLLFFLRDFGATAVISVSMPVCIISVFLIMRGLNITMNIMSLGGLAMGVGMIVDNSIVVLENIFRYRADGHDRWTSCTKGTGEVGLSIMAGTLTTVAVFLPIGLSGGVSGMLFREFCITISALLLASLVIALTLVPLLCYILLDRSGKKTRFVAEPGDIADRPVMRIYKRLLGYFIRRRGLAMLVSLAMIVLFGLSIGIAGFEMMPEMDQGQISVSVGMPVGAELQDTAAICDRITHLAEDAIPEMQSIYYTAGGASLLGGGTAVTIDVGSKAERTRSTKEIADALRGALSDIAGADLTVSASGAMDMSGLTGSAISVTLRGNDYQLLTETGDRLAAEIGRLPDAVDVSSSAAEQTPQVDITLSRTNAARFGLNAAMIGQAVRSELTGTTATTLKMGGEEIRVSVKGDSRSKTSLDALRATPIPTPMGGSVPLGTVADVAVVLAPQQINRQNQSRTITITGDSASDDAVGISRSLAEVLDQFPLPDGITIETGGEMQEMTDSFITLAKALLVGVVLIYFVLSSQFESFLMPIIVMMILPVGLIGSLVGLPLTGQKISVVAFIGVIMLAGTVVNSSIVLVDYIAIRRGMGEDKNTAILNACPRRVRPVLMTTLTTILGLVPMAVGMGDGAEMMTPMAVVMITGMVISTIVTLLFTPVYYSLLDSLSARLSRKRKGGKNGSDGNDESESIPAEKEAMHV